MIGKYLKPIPIISFVATCVGIVTIISTTNRIKPIESEEQVMTETPQPIEEYQYMLKEHNGKLGVFEQDKKEPYMLLDVNIETLPKIDIIQLKQGLKIKDKQELNDRIEDFSS